MLAAFIDVVVFLLAFATGPYFFGSMEHRWISAGAALEGLDHQIFTRDFLRKLTPGPRGMARVEASALTPGEQQLCLLWAAKKLAVVVEEDGRQYYHAGAGNSRTVARIASIPAIPAASLRRSLALWRTHLRAAFNSCERYCLLLPALSVSTNEKVQLVLHRIHTLQQHLHRIPDTKLAPASAARQSSACSPETYTDRPAAYQSAPVLRRTNSPAPRKTQTASCW